MRDEARPKRAQRTQLGGALWLALTCVVACSEPVSVGASAPASAQAWALPAGPVAHAPWAAAACVQAGGTAAVACVNGVAISAQQVQAAWTGQPSATRDRIVQALVDAELLAQAAAAAGGWASGRLAGVARQTLVQRVLQRAMAPITADRISAADVALAYKTTELRAHYDHVDAYFALDAQILCCSGDPHQCGQREDVVACIDKAAPMAQAAYSALVADPPQSAEEMWGRCKALVDRYPDLAVAEVHFFYDKAKPHDQQKGYDVMVQEFARPVTALQPGQLHEPIRSAFGWHIPFLHKIESAQHRDWRDPAVHKEIAEHIVLPVRQRDSQRYVFGLMQGRSVQYFFERLDNLRAAAPAAESAAEDL